MICIINIDYMEESNIPLTYKTICPKSVTGSRRHLRSLSLDALTTVAEYGAPTFFITLTCNTKWREIQERLLDGQDAFDRPDIVMQVTYLTFYTYMS
jgi:Helitron helicase-like domain at N-terminus